MKQKDTNDIIKPHDPLLTISDLSVGYTKTIVAEKISLSVTRGAILVLIGPNGAGKSTVLKTIAGLLDPVSGEIIFDGKKLSAYAGTERARKLAALFPDGARAPHMTCYELVAAGRHPFTGQFNRLTEADERIIEEAFLFVGAETLGARMFDELSDGQKQRVRIARTIAQSPELVILDEPTAFLDIRYKLEILSVLKRLSQERRTTILMSLHDVDLTKRIADQVLTISADHVWECGAAEAVLTEQKMRRLFGMSDEIPSLTV